MREIRLTEQTYHRLGIEMKIDKRFGRSFYGKEGKEIKDLILPDTFESGIDTFKIFALGEKFFSYAYNLKNIAFSKYIEEVDSGCFLSSGLENVTLNEGLLRIKDYAFFNTNLKKVYLPASLKEIESSAFYSPNGKVELITQNIDNIKIHENVLSQVILRTPTLDELVKENKTFKDINNFYKEKENYPGPVQDK